MSACHLRRRLLALLVVPLAVLGACSDDGGDDTSSSTSPSATGDAGSTTAVPDTETTTTAPAAGEPLRILVTNDDGIGAPGIDALVQALTALPDTEVTVVAPAENQTGSSDATTVDPPAADAATASGYAGTAIEGEPADTILWAADQGWTDGGVPHVVISGINEGQNIGPLAALSGTVGAARQAARLGVPALALSAGLIQGEGDELIAEYDDGVEAALTWLDEHRAELLARDLESIEPALVTKIDIPTCPAGSVRETVDVPLATAADVEGVDVFAVDCESTLTDPTDDVNGFVNGFVVVTELPVDELDALLAG